MGVYFLRTYMRVVKKYIYFFSILFALSFVSPPHVSAQVVTLTPPDGMAGRGIMFTGKTYNSGPEVTGPTTSIFPNIFQILQ